METELNNFGVIPFWFWNGKQNEKEITRQLELVARAGVRGMTVHARRGNQIEYMSERWMELFRHTCLEARRLKLEIWLYDEEGCPSGTVGERLPTGNAKYQQQALTFSYMTAGQACSEVNYTHGFRSEDVLRIHKKELCRGDLVRVFQADELKTPVNPAELSGNTKVLVFSKVYITDYIDALSRETLEEFLVMTHRIYSQKLGEFFSDPITAVYTDDLNHLLIYGDDIPYLSYTDSLEETFRRQHNYSILDNLPALVENLPGCEKIRIDYRHTVMRMFLDNYVEPMRQWCEEHGLPLTGHLSGDESDMFISISRFGAAMPFYEHEDIPGIDDFMAGITDGACLRRAFNEFGHSMIILCKQASSVASQLKNGQCSSEVLTSRGWGVPVYQQMTQLYFQLGLGVNILIPHDFSYSTSGVTKRDHPASYFFQQPWFCENREIQKTLSNSLQLLSRGICAAKVAVLNPVTSGWAVLDGERLAKDFSCQYPGRFPDTESLKRNFAEISLHLLQKHIDFEYIDEELLSRHGKVNEKILNMGNKTYDTLLLPPMINVQQTTLDLLEAFAANGGRIIQIGTGAVLVNGHVQNKVFNSPITAIADLNDWDVENCIMHPLLEFEGADEILLHTRQIDGHLEYFLINFSDKTQKIKIDSALKNYVVYDPQNDWIISDNGNYAGSFVLQSSACCHIVPRFVIPQSATVNIEETLFDTGLSESLIPTESVLEVSVEAGDDNNLLIDAGYLPDGKRILFSASENIPVGTVITVPINIPHPEKVFYLYAETAELENILVNGEKLNRTPGVNHSATQDLHQASLSGLLLHGNNEIKIISAGKRIEMFYLSGKFSVELSDGENGGSTKISAMPLVMGNAAQQGLPFYWGKLKYSTEFNIDDADGNYWIDLGKLEGVIKLLVNGKNASFLYKSPWLFKLDGLVNSGQNLIEIELFNTAQNFFGPHRKENIFGKNRSWEGSSKAAWTPELSGTRSDSWGVASFGLYGPVKLLNYSNINHVF